MICSFILDWSTQLIYHLWPVNGSNEVKQSFLEGKFKHVIAKTKYVFCLLAVFFNLFKLQVPNVMTATYGQRTFSYCAPKLWNGLPMKSLKES